MTRVLFVHGTMTRYDPGYVRTTSTIRERLRGWRADTAFEPFPWGEYWGAELSPRFVAIPGYDERVGPGVLGGAGEAVGADIDEAVAIWGLLYDDPAVELRLLAAEAQPAPGARQSDTSVALIQALYALVDDGPAAPLAQQLADGGIAGGFAAALGWAIALFNASDAQLQAALRTVSDAELDGFRGALARAVVAEAMRQAEAAGAHPALYLDAGLRDGTVAAVEQALGAGAVLSGEGWRGPPKLGILAELLARPRFGLTRLALTFLGDILTYQAKRATIQREIAQRLGDGPTVLLAHSLGGIACVDLLLSDEAARARVPLLITAGSQAGMLHEIGALGTLGPAGAEPTRLPGGFPPWLNLYDSNDMLGFRAAPLFAGTVRDVELRTGQPLYQAHGAYWYVNRAWEHILAALDEPGNVMYQLR